MRYKLDITPHEFYIHIKVSDSGTFTNTMDGWKEIIDASHKYNCYNILGEQHISTILSTLDALTFPEMIKQAGLTSKFRIAWVDTNPRTRETTTFIRNLLTSRSMINGRLFKNVEDAKQWLLLPFSQIKT